ncbi:MAG: hypothetical protein NTW21_13005 [Verrucomicrobia bacterium]|nr:hypothetical protein [Verrucomicrobiota bacterium]
MQRLIVAAGILLVLMLMAGGSWFAYRTYQQNRSTRIWLPLPINLDLSAERRQEMVKMLKTKLSEPALLVQVSKDVGLAKRLKLATDEAAGNDLGKRLFVELGEAETPKGKLPSINVGMTCKVKEYKTMDEVMSRLRQDVFKILGVPEPKKEVF